jgi:hypothetical protein
MPSHWYIEHGSSVASRVERIGDVLRFWSLKYEYHEDQFYQDGPPWDQPVASFIADGPTLEVIARIDGPLLGTIATDLGSLAPRWWLEPPALVTTLLTAARAGQLDAVRAALAAGAPVEAYDERGVTVLGLAVRVPSLPIVEALLDAGADIHRAFGAHRDTVLHEAPYTGSRPLVQLLLARGALLEARRNDGETPLIRATRAADPAIVATLIEAGADVRARADSNMDALAAAVARCPSTNLPLCEVCEMLIASGADVAAPTQDGTTPMHLAVGMKNERLVAGLLNAGARGDVKDARGKTPLQLAEAYHATACAAVIRGQLIVPVGAVVTAS